MDNWFATLMVGVGGILATIATFLTTRKTARASEITAEAEAEQTLSDGWQKYAAQMRSDLNEYKEEANKKIKALEDNQSKLEGILKDQGEREARTSADLEAVFTWIENGMNPPPPERPIYLTKERRPPWSRPKD